MCDLEKSMGSRIIAHTLNSCSTDFSKLNLLFLLCSLFVSLPVYAQEILLGNFAQQSLSGWEKQAFSGITHYQIVRQGNKYVLRARTNGTASGLINKTKIDLTQTPYLNWSWKIKNTYNNKNETKKIGDDYPARISIVSSGGLFFWQTRAINYVWTSQKKINTTWDNPYTANVKMLAIQSGKNFLNTWKTEKRNVKKDFKDLFGIDINSLDAIAIMTDGDNTQSTATTYYGQIYFSNE